jgi:C4-dicarboxylate transporter DctQ subunit
MAGAANMKAARRYLANFEMIFAAFLLVLLTVLLTVQIVNRYILGTSFVWLEEIARLSFVWMIYFSAAGAARDDRHIRIEIIDLFVPPAVVRAVTVVADILVIGFDLVVVWLGILLVRSTIQYGDVTPVTDIPMGLVYAVIPVCFALMAYRLFRFNMGKRTLEPAAYDSYE